MDSEFFTQKIKQLTNEKLKELIRLKTKENREIVELAEKEAIERGIDLATIDPRIKEISHKKKMPKSSEGLYWMSVLAQFLNENS